MKKLIVLGSAFVILQFSINAQDVFNNKLAAFSTSYEKEYTQNYDEAIKPLENIYSKDDYEINLRLGWLYYSKGDHNKSVAFYKKAVVLKPSSVEAKLALVNPLSYLGNWDEIVTTYEELLKVDPKNYTVNYRLSMIWYNRKKYAQALIYIKTIQPLYPFDYEANLLAGKINIALGNITDAKSALQKAIIYNPLSTEPVDILKGL
ncbi:MAG: tetratricopeptide repeat protein [Bacteroidetes bacterium]|nr:tetratricopeptide repeat protein [Bacteroidota bacterium]